MASMLISRLVSIAYCLPSLKRLLWRSWYQFLARRYRDPGWVFMNYGYQSAPGDASLALDSVDEPDRYCIQLYHRVASTTDLAGRDVLEVGSGRGGGASFLARYLRPRRIVGIDISPGAVAFSRARHHADNLSFEVGDAEHLALPDAAFDVILNVESSHCYGNIDAFLRELARILRPGGYFLYADFRARTELKAWRTGLLKSGLQLITETDITPGVVAALDADDERKRRLITRQVDRPLVQTFGQFPALRGTLLYDKLRAGSVVYCAFVFQKTARAVTA